MAKARKIILDTRTFEKVGDATNFFRSMLNRYSIGSRISEDDGRDLSALLKRHDEMNEKIGVGIAHFEVEAAPETFSGRCFWIVRKDGSKIDFSFTHCLSAKPYD